MRSKAWDPATGTWRYIDDVGGGGGGGGAVDSVNGQVGTVVLTAADVKARPDTWTPTAADVGARPDTWNPVKTAVITSEAGRYVCDMTASQIVDADRVGTVKAEFTDPTTGDLRVYQYAKKVTDGRAVFSKDGYIEDGVPKQTLIFVDYAGNVTTETYSADMVKSTEKGAVNGVASLGSDGKVPAGQLPAMDYIPANQKGTASGVATLDGSSKVPVAQIPALDYATPASVDQKIEDAIGAAIGGSY